MSTPTIQELYERLGTTLVEIEQFIDQHREWVGGPNATDDQTGQAGKRVLTNPSGVSASVDTPAELERRVNKALTDLGDVQQNLDSSIDAKEAAEQAALDAAKAFTDALQAMSDHSIAIGLIRDEATGAATTASQDRTAAHNSAQSAFAEAERAVAQAQAALTQAGLADQARAAAVLAVEQIDGTLAAAIIAKNAAEEAESSARQQGTAAVQASVDAQGRATTALSAASSANQSAQDADSSAQVADDRANAAITASADALSHAELVAQVSLTQGLISDFVEPAATWQTSTDYAGSSKYVLQCEAGKAALRVQLTDSEGGVRIAFNGEEVGIPVGADGEQRWYEYVVDALDGDNEVAIWAVSSESGSIDRIELRGGDQEARFSGVEERLSVTEDEAFWSVKVDNNGRVAGFGARSDPSGTSIYFDAERIGFTNGDVDLTPFYMVGNKVFMENVQVTELEASSIRTTDVSSPNKHAQLGNTVIVGDFTLAKSGQIRLSDLDPSFRDLLLMSDPNAVTAGGTRTLSTTPANGTIWIAKDGDANRPALTRGPNAATVSIQVSGGTGWGGRSKFTSPAPSCTVQIYRKPVGGSAENLGSHTFNGSLQSTQEDAREGTTWYWTSISGLRSIAVPSGVEGTDYEYYAVVSGYTGEWGPTPVITLEAFEISDNTGGIQTNSLLADGETKFKAVTSGATVTGAGALWVADGSTPVANSLGELYHRGSKLHDRHNYWNGPMEFESTAFFDGQVLFRHSVEPVFEQGLKLAAGTSIQSAYSDDIVLKDHNNGNVTLSAAGNALYLGYQNTAKVVLARPLTNPSQVALLGANGEYLYVWSGHQRFHNQAAGYNQYIGVTTPGGDTQSVVRIFGSSEQPYVGLFCDEVQRLHTTTDGVWITGVLDGLSSVNTAQVDSGTIFQSRNKSAAGEPQQFYITHDGSAVHIGNNRGLLHFDNRIEAANGFADRQPDGLGGIAGNYGTGNRDPKIIWTIGESWRTHESHFGLGYEYGSQINGSNDHQIVIKKAGTANIRFGMGGSTWQSGINYAADHKLNSDERIKAKLEVITGALAKTRLLTGYTYDQLELGTRESGIIAQDLAKAVPEGVRGVPDAKLGEKLTVSPMAAIALLVNAVNELADELEAIRGSIYH